jgi:putative integral membrane protein (TIGR02587 family)
VAYLVAVIAAALVLALFGELTWGMSLNEIIGKIAVQSVPAGMGAVLARSQLGMQEEQEEEERRRSFYASELFLMGAGGLFFAFNVAPTDEVVLIAFQQGDSWYLLATVAASLAVMHAFVYAVGFRGQHEVAAGRSGLVEFAILTVPGYAIVLGVCFFVLWSFGRLEGLSVGVVRDMVLVLGFPGAVGAATARLVL